MPLLVLTLVLSLLVSSCASRPAPADALESRARYLMGTMCALSLPPGRVIDADADAAFDEIARIEARVSTWRADSELSRINRAAPGTAVGVSREVADLLDRASRLADETKRAFTPVAGRLIELWDLRGDGRVPDDGSVRAATEAIAVGGLRVDRARLAVARIGDVTVEEGGFAKGYALDRALDVLRRRGVPRAVLDFGGQVALYGFERPFEIDIAHPEDRRRPAVRVAISSGSIATSSGAETWFERDGTRYAHIVDPRSGIALPPSGSATAIHEEALVADALSTAFYVLGPAEGRLLADRKGYAAIWLVPAGDGAWRVVRSAAASALPLEIHSDFHVTKESR